MSGSLKAALGIAAAIAVSLTAGAETIRVKPGDDVQAAIDAAAAGDTVLLSAGRYTDPIVISTAGVTVQGAIDNGKRAVVDCAGAHLQAVRVQADGVTVSNLVLRNAMATGAVVHRANEVTLDNLIVESNSFIGINASDTANLAVRNCAVSEHASAGILLAQSSQATISGTLSFHNLTGIRVENSDNFVIENNTFARNATGIALLTLPGRSKPRTAYGHLHYNRVFDNNRPNTSDPGTVDAAMIPGVGVYVVGADHIEFARGRLERNGTYAILTVSLANSSLAFLGEAEDSTTDHLYVHHNAYSDNGAAAAAAFNETFPNQPAGDLYWDGRGERNQWQETGEFRTVPENLVQEQGGAHTNVIHFL